MDQSFWKNPITQRVVGAGFISALLAASGIVGSLGAGPELGAVVLTAASVYITEYAISRA